MPKIPSPLKMNGWQKPPISPQHAVTLPALYDALSIEEKGIVRRKYTEMQQGLCCACGAPLEGTPPEDVFEHRINWSLFPENFLEHPVHLHHCKQTGLTIGSTHALCNAVLFQVYGE